MKNIRNLTISYLDAKSLYIHIPFCEHICSYCDFTKTIYKREIAFLYVSKIIDDIEYLSSYNLKYKTIYIGGGTPTSLENSDLKRLLESIKKLIDFNKKYEFTVEANIENISEEKLKILKENGVNRISIGVQSFNDEILKKYNRYHTSKEALNKIELTKKYFKNINIDLIYAVPFSSFEILKEDLNKITSLGITHISLYSLQINKNTLFYKQNIQELNQDETRNQYDFIVDFLKKHNFIHYEVSNFALKGYESKHNIVYWKDKKYLALGAGASGYIKNIRYKNTINIFAYINKDEIEEIEYINKDSDFVYYLITNLRLLEGINIKKLNKKFNCDFISLKSDALKNLEKMGYIEYSPTHLKCTEKGIFILDSIILKLI